MTDEERPDQGRDDKVVAGRTAREVFEGLWAEEDPWDQETSELDQRRYARQLALLVDRRYGRALELGCGAGSFTRHLIGVCDSIVAVDIAPSAIARARGLGLEQVNLRVANIMDFDVEGEGRWDLLVLTETATTSGGFIRCSTSHGWPTGSARPRTRAAAFSSPTRSALTTGS